MQHELRNFLALAWRSDSVNRFYKALVKKERNMSCTTIKGLWWYDNMLDRVRELKSMIFQIHRRRGRQQKKRPRKHVNHHLIMNLEHSGIITKKRWEGNVGAAGNYAKFLTSSWSSAHIPYNVWTWTILSSAKQRRGEERGRFGKKI